MIRIETMDKSNQHIFGEIWLPWLEKTIGAVPQAEDLEAMARPVDYYGQTNGAAFLAYFEDNPVGVVTVKGLEKAGYEFCKLVVDPAARGHGLGQKLIQKCLDFATDQGGPYLWLQSFNRLETALGIYHRMGFEHAPAPVEMSVFRPNGSYYAKVGLAT